MYHQLYQRVLWPAYEGLVKRRKTCRLWRFLEESQWWSLDRLATFQSEELTKLLTHLYSNSPYFEGVCREKGIRPPDFHDRSAFLHLPIIDKDDIRNNLDRMRSKSAQGWTISKSTGGSTGQPLHFVHDEASYEWRIAMAYRAYAWARCEDGRKTAYIWGGAIGDPSRKQTFKEDVHHLLQRRKIFNSFHFTDERMLRCYHFIQRYRPDGLVGYTNALCNLARFIRKQKLQNLTVGNIVTAAEGVDEDQKALMETVFGGRSFKPMDPARSC